MVMSPDPQPPELPVQRCKNCGARLSEGEPHLKRTCTMEDEVMAPPVAQPRRFTRWADEGGRQIEVTEQPNGALIFVIFETAGGGHPSTPIATATLANFRRADLLRWLQGETV